MRHISKTVALATLTCALNFGFAGCATPYTPYGIAGGFEDIQLDQNVFRITFEGNGFTSANSVEEMTLLRSAELTLQNGFTHFAIVNSQADNSPKGTITLPSTASTSYNSYGRSYGGTYTGTGQATTFFSGGSSWNFSFPSASNTIVCFKGKPDMPGMFYNARMICNALGKKYNAICKEKPDNKSSPTTPIGTPQTTTP